MLADRILTEATTLFLRDGYAVTSMEAVAAAAGVSKRTLYKRFADKAALLRASVEHLIQHWLPPFEQAMQATDTLETALLAAARQILAAALAPESLALHRLMVAEAARFPELTRVLHEAGANLGITRIASLIGKARSEADRIWAAEQCQRLVLTGPQQRALGLGTPLDAAELESWAQRSVQLFLHGMGQR